jgi:integrase
MQRNIKYQISGGDNSNQYYRNFINSCKSEATKNDYRKGLSYFMNYLNIESAKEDYSCLIDGRDTKIIQTDIINWIIHMKDTVGLSPASINLYTAAVNHFYTMNDITLNIRRINAFKPEFHNVVEDQPYTREQIKLLLDKAEQRNRAIILLLSSSGMRVGALHNLKVGDLTPIDKYNIYQIHVYKRSKSKYITFCTPECRKEIDLHLQYRKRYGELITDKSPVFRTTFNRNDQFKAANKIKPFSTVGIKCMVNELLNTTGIRPSQKMTEGMKHTSNRTNLMEVHGFRKFFDTTCTTAGMDSLYTELLMGHDIGLKGRYTKLTSENLLEGNDKNLGYISVIDSLTINEENRLRRQIKTQKENENELHGIKIQQASMQNMLMKLVESLASTTDQTQLNTIAKSLAASGILKPKKD